MVGIGGDLHLQEPIKGKIEYRKLDHAQTKLRLTFSYAIGHNLAKAGLDLARASP